METLQRTANRGSISTGNYEIGNSVKLESDNGERFLAADPFQDYDSVRIFTRSLWVKRSEITNHQQLIADFSVNTNVTITLQFDATDHLKYFVENSGDKINLITNRLFRDMSAWYHIFLVVDTTQGTAANRVKIYVNGVQETSFATEVYPTQNLDLPFQTRTYMFGYDGGNNGFCGYATEFHALDGIAAAPTDFGEFDDDSGIWIPIEYEGNYGTEGYYLNFSDSANMGKDHGPNAFGNAFADPSGVTAADQTPDTPTNNFCTFNPLVRVHNNPTFSDGAMKVTGGGGTFNQAFGSIGVSSGKWYFEVKVLDASDTGYFGLSTHPAIPDSVSGGQLMYNTSFIVGAASGIDYYYWSGGSQTSDENTGWGNLANGNVLGFAIDLDASTRTCKIFRNNSALSGNKANPFDLTANMQTGFLFPMYVQYEQNLDVWRFGAYTENTPDSVATDANGYGNFEYAPPSGFYAICTKNLAEYGG